MAQNRSSIMGLHGLKNKTSRNTFDLSHRNLFTAKVGELLPCCVLELNPGDTVNVNSSYFTRTAPLQSAAFTRLRENIQFFFVPYSQLWKYFEQQVNNMKKSAAGGSISRIADSFTEPADITTEMPYVNYNDLHLYLRGMIGDAQESETSDEFFNHGEYRWSCSAKLLQMLGYGNFTDYFNVEPHTDFQAVNFSDAPNLSLFRLLAYQKICNDHYEYRQWQPYNSYLCNIDYLKPSSSSTLQLNPNRFVDYQRWNMFDMRFSNLPLDYFNGVLPVAQYGDESVVSLNSDSSAKEFLTPLPYGHDAYSQDQNFAYLYTTHGEDLSVSSYKFGWLGLKSGETVPNGLSVSSLRSAIALQKYKEIQLANDADFVSQVEAHFGIKPKHSDYKSYFIGGNSSNLDINPQVNSNLDTWSNQNFMKAAPSGSGSASVKYTADTYGVFIGIYRCTPILDYANIGIDRTLFKTDASDFVIPELDSIGMQQTYNCEVAAPTVLETEDFNPSDFSFEKTYGFAPRYSEYKTSHDRYNGEFCKSLESWVTGLNASQLRDLYKDWNSKSTAGELAVSLFECRPDIVSSIFLNMNTEKVSDDNLFVGLLNNVTAVRNLSRYGLPYCQ